MVYVDECGVNTFMTRTHGRAPRGERLNVPQPGRRFKRLNIVAGWSSRSKQIIAPYLFSWNMKSAWFLVWFEFFLLPLLDPGTLIVLDNATFHNKTMIENIAKLYNCVVVFQPKYSPDLNPIEKYWANLKNWLRLKSSLFSSIQSAVIARFQQK